MLNVLYVMHQAHEPLTLASVIEITGMTRGGVLETMDNLVERGILTQTMGKNSLGRGTARQFGFAKAFLNDLYPRMNSLITILFWFDQGCGDYQVTGRQPSAHSFLNDSGNDLKGIWIKTWTFYGKVSGRFT